MTPARRALVTNDDGIDSAGLEVLARSAVDAGWDVVVAAPERQHSGASAALTADQVEGRTVVEKRPPCGGAPAYAVHAAPAHIVLAALRGWLDPPPDLVLSGVNRGANVGRAVLHSGTVGAALTASLHGSRGLAVSLDVALGSTSPEHWDAAAGYLPHAVQAVQDAPEGTTLSLNVPDRPSAAHHELRHAPLDPQGSVRTVIDEYGEDGMLVHEVEIGDRPRPGSDRALLAEGHPTLTALRGICEAGEAA